MSEEVKEAPDGVLEQGEFKIKKKPKKLVSNNETLKVDLSKPKESLIEEKEETTENKTEEKVEKTVEQESPVIEEIKEETKQEEVKTEEPKKEVESFNVPENLQNLVKFMEETGGDINDYVRLNTDYSTVDEKTLLNEYYKSTKPHLDQEEIGFLMKDNFSYDEELDEERDIRKKKIAYKEEIAKAKNFLEETKNKYYQEIKLRPSTTKEQQKAMDFFNRYNENKQRADKQHEEFLNRTNEYFTKDFKGFEFNLGDKKFNYAVNNAEEIAKDQAELQTFVKKFLNDDGSINDHKAYHKAMYAARNSDNIAKHFYEQGKTDGIKEMVNKSKNIDTASRPQNNEDIFIGGFKVKAVSGVDSSKLKIQKRKK
jgi:hypothetical protein